MLTYGTRVLHTRDMTTTQTQTTGIDQYRYLGSTDDVLRCDHCGRSDLTHTVVLELLDADGDAEEVVYFGSTCAARALSGRFGVKVTAADVRRGVKAADDAAREARRIANTASHDAIMAARDSVLRAWGLDPRTAKPSDCLRALGAAATGLAH